MSRSASLLSRPTMASAAVGGLFGVVLIFACRYLLTVPMRLLAASHEDDTFYYLQIGDELAHGHPFTYDGVDRTNGFHPLWAAVVAVLVRLFGRARAAEMYFGVQLLLYVAAVVVLAVVLVRSTGSRVIPIALVLASSLSFYAVKVTLTGLETPLFLLVAMLATLGFQQWSTSPTDRQALLLGLLLSLCFPARLETGLVMCAVFGVAFVVRHRRSCRRRLGLFVAGIGVPSISYVAASLAFTGLVLPVSGLYKSRTAGTRPAGDSLRSLLDDFGIPIHALLEQMKGRVTLEGSVGASLLAMLLLVAHGVASHRRGRLVSAVNLFVLAALLSFLVQKASYGFAPIAYYYVMPWYVACLILVVSLTAEAARLVRGWMPRSSRRLALALAVLALLPVANFARRAVEVQRARGLDLAAPSDDFDRVVAAEWMRDHLPAGTRIASFNSGIYGWFSGHAMFNLDGKVNSRRFYEEIRFPQHSNATLTERLLGYLAANRVTVIAEKLPCEGWEDSYPLAGHLRELHRVPDAMAGMCSYVFELTP